jgi:hypothetical protein
MSEKPIILKDEFRDAKVAKIVYESPTYVSLKIYLQGHNRDWYEAITEISKNKIKKVGE